MYWRKEECPATAPAAGIGYVGADNPLKQSVQDLFLPSRSNSLQEGLSTTGMRMQAWGDITKALLGPWQQAEALRVQVDSHVG